MILREAPRNIVLAQLPFVLIHEKAGCIPWQVERLNGPWRCASLYILVETEASARSKRRTLVSSVSCQLAGCKAVTSGSQQLRSTAASWCCVTEGVDSDTPQFACFLENPRIMSVAFVRTRIRSQISIARQPCKEGLAPLTSRVSFCSFRVPAGNTSICTRFGIPAVHIPRYVDEEGVPFNSRVSIHTFRISAKLENLLEVASRCIF